MRVLSTIVLLSSIVSAQNRAPSCWLNYGDSFAGDIIMNQISVISPSPLYTYYCVLQWNAGQEGGGYCGLQDHPDGRNIIYSIWDPAASDDPIVAEYVGYGTAVENFGGEGTGLKSWNFDLGWESNTWYTLVTRAWDDDDHTFFGFWIRDNNDGNWFHVVTMDYPVSNVRFSSQTGSFIEDWWGNGSESRRAHYMEGWKRSDEDGWSSFPSTGSYFSRVSPDAGAQNYIDNYDGGIENEYYFMQSGGETVPTNGSGIWLDLDYDNIEPLFNTGNIADLEVIVDSTATHLQCSWDIFTSVDPQYSYQIQVFEDEECDGTPLIEHSDIRPQAREAIIEIDNIYNSGTYYIKLSIVDIFDEEKEPLIGEFTIPGQDMSIGVGDVNTTQGDTIGLPIWVDLPENGLYRAVEVHISGYETGLDFIGVETIGSILEGQDWLIEAGEDTGSLILAAAGSNEISGDGILCFLDFTVIGDICTEISINCDFAEINLYELSDIQNGLVTISPVPVFGDVNQNGEVDTMDASDILIQILDAQEFGCQQRANADAYFNNIIDAMDASIILKHIVGDIDSLPLIPSEEFIASADLAMNDQNAVAGSVVWVPINISNCQNIYSFEGSITYDPLALTPTDNIVTWSSLLHDFIIDIRVEDGLIRFVGASSNLDGETGVFVTLNFNLNEYLDIDSQTSITIDSIKFNSNLVIQDLSANIMSVVSIDSRALPLDYALSQNFPNPFNPSTTIEYGLPEDSNVSLIIYDLRGNTIQVLDSGMKSAGWYEIIWNGQTNDGRTISTGLYFARIVAGDYSQVIKMLYLK